MQCVIVEMRQCMYKYSVLFIEGSSVANAQNR